MKDNTVFELEQFYAFLKHILVVKCVCSCDMGSVEYLHTRYALLPALVIGQIYI